MKIDAQLKIAELERRIVALEDAAKSKTVRTTTTETVSVGKHSSVFGEDWDRMWTYFDRVMKKVMQ